MNDMHEIDNFIDPIEILLEHTSAKERYLHDDFIDLNTEEEEDNNEDIKINVEYV